MASPTSVTRTGSYRELCTQTKIRVSRTPMTPLCDSAMPLTNCGDTFFWYTEHGSKQRLYQSISYLIFVRVSWYFIIHIFVYTYKWITKFKHNMFSLISNYCVHHVREAKWQAASYIRTTLKARVPFGFYYKQRSLHSPCTWTYGSALSELTRIQYRHLNRMC